MASCFGRWSQPVPVTAMAIVPGDGSLVYRGRRRNGSVAGSADGRERLLLKGHTGAVLDLAVRADAAGTTRIVGVGRRTARIWTISLAGGAAANGESRNKAPSKLRRSCWLVTRDRCVESRYHADGQTIVTRRGRRDRAKLEGPRRQTARCSDGHRSCRGDPRRGRSARTER